MNPAEKHLEKWRKENKASEEKKKNSLNCSVCPNCKHCLEEDQAQGQFTFKVCPNCQHVFDLH